MAMDKFNGLLIMTSEVFLLFMPTYGKVVGALGGLAALHTQQPQRFNNATSYFQDFNYIGDANKYCYIAKKIWVLTFECKWQVKTDRHQTLRLIR
ncbi:MAG: hypothetical protein LH615_00550 [Ferruginibacter sp.]|nr:hypothetical protein [Ferruginibacter sp.]